jgi:ribosome-binding factor A
MRTPRTSQRGRRVDEILRQVVSETLTGMSDPRLRLVTVTGVRATRDGAYADVFVQVHGNEHRREKALAALESVRPVLQATINAQLHMRRTPVLRFEYDESYDRGARIEELLRGHVPAQGEEG